MMATSTTSTHAAVLPHREGGRAPWWASYQREVLFRDGGRIWPHVDCFGFLRVAYARECGIILPEWPDLTLKSLSEEGRSLTEEVFTAAFKPVETGLETVFDGALICRPMAVNGVMRKGWWHCGIVSRPGFIVHLEPAQGIVETAFRDTAASLGDPAMRPKDVRLYRAQLASADANSMECAA